jgi:Mrp family chromosome partitioning ATPase
MDGSRMNKLVANTALLRAEAGLPTPTTGHLPRLLPDWADVATADLPSPENDAPMEFIEAYNAIGRQLGHVSSPIVQVVAPRAGDGGTEVAYGIAWAGASMLGQRVLFVHASDEPVPGVAGLQMPELMSLNDVVAGRADLQDALVRGHHVDLHVAVLRRQARQEEVFAAAFRICNILRMLRNGFNAIIVAPGAANRDPLAAILTKVVDGSVLVVRAESTTHGAARRTRDLLTSGGTPVLGVVLNREKHHIPGWMARWF